MSRPPASWWIPPPDETVTCILDEVAVAEAQRRYGIGSHLVAMAAKLMLADGFQRDDPMPLTGENSALRSRKVYGLASHPTEAFPSHFLHAKPRSSLPFPINEQRPEFGVVRRAQKAVSDCRLRILRAQLPADPV